MQIRTAQDQTMRLRDYVAKFVDMDNGSIVGALVERLVEKGLLDVYEVDEILNGPWSIVEVAGTKCPKCHNDTWAGDRCFHPPCKAVRLKDQTP